MAKNLLAAHQETTIDAGIIPGFIIGGFIGLLIGYLDKSNILSIPGFNTIFSTLPFDEIIGGTIAGVIIGGVVGGLLALSSPQKINTDHSSEISTPKQSVSNDRENVTVQMKEEQLHLAKKWIQTGEVKIYRETFNEEKSFTVPVEREELVIEKKALASATQEHREGPTEVIRIRLSEEQVEFTKHKVALEDVSIYKQEIEEIKRIEETLKKEALRVNISGSAKVSDEIDSVHPDI